MPVAYTGMPHDAAFLGSQDGYAYCFNAVTGAGCASWPAGGRSAASFGMLQAAPMLAPGSPGKLFVGSRLAAAANSMNALNVLTGATLWSFTNSVGQGGNGQAIGLISSKAYADTAGNIVYFASRRRSGGSSNTVWAVGYGTGSPVLLWARDLGDIDGSLTSDFTSNRMLVGTNAGEVYALDPATGATVWSRSFGDGAVKTFVYFDSVRSRLYFATNTKVWSIPASGATGSDWSVTLNSPTRPLLHFGTSRVYVGACADVACANGRLVELDSANAWATPKSFDLAGGGGLGPVTIDRTQSPAMAQAGSRTGRVHAVALPLP
jgi:outer membrane protein assembly factor BamB